MATSAVSDDRPPLGGGRRTYAYIAGVAFGALVCLVLLLTMTAWVEALRMPVFWVLLTLVLVTEASPLTLPSRRGDVTTTSDTFAFALMLSVGLPGGVIALLATVVAFDAVRRRGAVKTLFNGAQLMLALVAAGVVVSAVSGTPVGAPVSLDTRGIVAALLGIGAFVIVNQVLLGQLLALLEGTSLGRQLRQNHDLFLTSFVPLLLAPIVVAAAQVNLLLMALLVVPMVGVHRATALYLAREQLLRGQKLEALGRLSGGVAHDFNNLLAVVLANAELLASDIDDPEQAARLRELETAARRGASLADQILSFTRGQQTELVPVDVASVLRRVAPMLSTLVGSEVTLDIQLGEGPTVVSGTETELEQVLVNLVVNARDAMPSGGTLGVSVDRMPDRTVLIQVSDTGIGMDDETQQRAFEPFYTTKGLGRGTGLGLSIVYGIISGWDGEVTIDSTPGGGTKIEISLPAIDPAEAPAVPDSPAPRADAGEATGSVLVVEDEDPLRGIVVGVLRRRGYVVLDAPDPATALEVARTHPGKIDLLLTDLSMPGMTGIELAHRLRASRPTMAVLCMTGFAPGTGEDLEGFDVLQKPFGLAELDERVRALLTSASPAP